MITNEMAEGFSELLLIIDNINEVLKNKIPIKFINFLNENKSDSYIPNIDLTKDLQDMNLKKETRYLLEILYLNYWSSEDEKNELLLILRKNEQKKQQDAKEKYDIDNLFTNKKTNLVENYEAEIDKQVSLVEYKESIFSLIWKKILSLFRKK